MSCSTATRGRDAVTASAVDGKVRAVDGGPCLVGARPCLVSYLARRHTRPAVNTHTREAS